MQWAVPPKVIRVRLLAVLAKCQACAGPCPKPILTLPVTQNGTSIDRRVDTCELSEGEVKPYPLGLDTTLRTSVWSIVMTENFSAF